jgi:hypothetical protein
MIADIVGRRGKHAAADKERHKPCLGEARRLRGDAEGLNARDVL